MNPANRSDRQAITLPNESPEPKTYSRAISWKRAQLKDVGILLRGVSFNKKEIKERPSDDYVPILRATNINDGTLDLHHFLFVKKNKIKPEQILRSGDIVMAMSSGSNWKMCTTGYQLVWIIWSFLRGISYE